MLPSEQSLPGTLYVAATPIGNLEDITLRCLRILGEVDLIAAEDTRHTRKLLTHFKIQTPLISYYREKEAQRSQQLVQRLLDGESIALVSDAGTPGISDPGAVLVSEARKAGIVVVPLPGASALTTALSAAGLSNPSFLFLGFPPSKKAKRRTLLTSLCDTAWPIIFYESPRRIQSLLTDILQIMGDRQAFWGRELTKAYEDLQAEKVSTLLELASGDKNRGEFVLIIEPGAIKEVEGDNLLELLAWYRDNTSMSLKDVSRKLASDLGLPRSQIYQEALGVYQEKKD
ncbi:MAG: 16S rRNA (cytidine(1402)-2'-O)-methyltransferase [Proteobacteria bacterium]|nr:16S rRNA (cytidine(1402)-2'-O)-methyltransferase [Pseudomonadota bacterium]MBU1057996.1 16S rRNA (cytidine(1402)-2'-O)-methyltransferase [Pseudomonadota bacterium]